MTNKPSYAELEARLARAEAVIHALRDGEVDAVIGAERVDLLRSKTRVINTETALIQTQHCLESIVENAPILLFTINEAGFITLLQGDTETMLGTDALQLIGWSIFRLSVDYLHFADSFNKVVQGEPLSITSTVGDKFLEVHYSPIFDPSGTTVIEVVGVAVDATARVQAEKLLHEHQAWLEQEVTQRTEELRQSNEALAKVAALKDEFLAHISHELRTPLNSILTSVEVLLEQIYGKLNDKQHQSIYSIQRNGEKLRDLINDILDMSKLEAGQLEIHISYVSVKQICSDSLARVRQIANQKKIAISTHMDKKVSQIHADTERLTQILVNLLSNAVKFTPDKGTVSLQVEGDYAKKLVHFSVTDSGIGIPEDKISLLFQPFQQVDKSLAREYAGTGLGLALVRRLTELQGGRVSLESQVGKGSRFTVSLPW